MATTSNHVISSGSEASDAEETKAVLPESRVRKTNVSNGCRGRRHSSRNRPSSRVKRPMKHFVNHNYHDHLHGPVVSSCDPVGTMGSISGENKEESSQHRRSSHRGGVATPFPEKLHYMLSRMEPEGTASIASWQPHGRCFLVHKPKEFVQEIMPIFFRQSKLTSFQRQLNLYGFSRLTAGPDRGGYYHELFIRGRMDLCKTIMRTRVKGNGTKAAASPSTEPNFYAMESCPADSDREVVSNRVSPLEIVSRHDDAEEIDTARPNAPFRIEDHPSDEEMGFLSDSDDEFFLKPLEDSSLSGFDMKRSESWASLEDTPIPKFTPSKTPSASKFQPCLVSPVEDKRDKINDMALKFVHHMFPPDLHLSHAPLVVHSGRKVEDKVSSISLRRAEPLHSGDEAFFEGLPFHYLETRDLEGVLLAVGVQTSHLLGS